MAGELNRFEFGLRDFESRRVGFLEMRGGDFQTGLSGRTADETQQDQQRAQDLPGPGHGDLAEQPMLNRIPFRSAGRIVTDRDLQPALVREVLQAFLVPPRAGRVTAAGIGFDHQARGLPVMRLAQSPPVANRIDGQVGGVAGRGHAHVSLVAFRIVDAVRCCAADRIRRKVVIVDLRGLLAPRLAGVFELADEFFFLRVHADPRVATVAKGFALRGDVLELLITLRVRLAGVQDFAMAPQAELLLAQQPADRRRTNAVVQRLRQPT